jgi:hypothetical protein
MPSASDRRVWIARAALAPAIPIVERCAFRLAFRIAAKVVAVRPVAATVRVGAASVRGAADRS